VTCTDGCDRSRAHSGLAGLFDEMRSYIPRRIATAAILSRRVQARPLPKPTFETILSAVVVQLERIE
jgi:hypothetical protein